ncbi:MAG TPA: hypothetical protein V6C84_27890 [Coleofasciculaceae cyanobacterium]|jgi:antitoxin (DNA-binding transcriptional repressor) of toxin-antitoxin stability system
MKKSPFSKDGIAVARLMLVPEALPPRLPGSAKGLITIAPDFDAPLPDEILAALDIVYCTT